MRYKTLVASWRFLGRAWQLCVPYWRSKERWRAWGLLLSVTVLTLGLVYLEVLFNIWNREFYNALEQRNQADYVDLLVWFTFLAALFIAAAIYRLYLSQALEMRWRAWLTHHYVADWLDRQIYYRLELENHGTDNPDQRIAEDLRLFTSGTLSLFLGLLDSVVTLVSFIAILWVVSGPISFALDGRTLTIDGYMVWAVLAYAIGGSILTHYVGRQLIGLNFRQERVEADFRFSLVRLRENAEGIALYRGEEHEKSALGRRFESVRRNWWAIMGVTKRLTGFTAGYTQIGVVFPFVVAAPRYFSGALTLGGLMQIASAFGQVRNALSWFVNNYSTLTSWKASVDRLLTFRAALELARAEAGTGQGVQVARDGERNLDAEALDVLLPGGRALITNAVLTIEPGERVLLTGPSGSGKSTLFRALAGIWPFGRGRISVPVHSRVLFLPQKPYIPAGSLREAVAYPSLPHSFQDEAIREALRAVGLTHLTGRLDEAQNWGLALSGGEQQKLAVARTLLQRPDWLFLDEATSAMDEQSERDAYETIAARLPGTAIVSIAHRPGVAAYHRRRIALVPDGDRATLNPV